jgi:hypothetical protein
MPAKREQTFYGSVLRSKMMREQSVSPYLGVQEAEDAMDANARGVVLREQLIAKSG